MAAMGIIWLIPLFWMTPVAAVIISLIAGRDTTRRTLAAIFLGVPLSTVLAFTAYALAPDKGDWLYNWPTPSAAAAAAITITWSLIIAALYRLPRTAYIFLLASIPLIFYISHINKRPLSADPLTYHTITAAWHALFLIAFAMVIRLRRRRESAA